MGALLSIYSLGLFSIAIVKTPTKGHVGKKGFLGLYVPIMVY